MSVSGCVPVFLCAGVMRLVSLRNDPSNRLGESERDGTNLTLHSTSVTGSLPPEIGSLSSLFWLNLHDTTMMKNIASKNNLALEPRGYTFVYPRVDFRDRSSVCS